MLLLKMLIVVYRQDNDVMEKIQFQKVFQDKVAPRKRLSHPRPQMKTFPLESPVMTSPVKLKARQVTYLGLSRWSNNPVLRDRVRLEQDQDHSRHSLL